MARHYAHWESRLSAAIVQTVREVVEAQACVYCVTRRGNRRSSWPTTRMSRNAPSLQSASAAGRKKGRGP